MADVGIIDIQSYFPNYYICQQELEVHDKVSSGKYTKGLGQHKMAVTTDLEDINSICLTVLNQLIERNNLDVDKIGRLEVGTETFLDKSKSIKTYLMSLLKQNKDVEGVTTSNACYGGTNALFNTINWLQSDFCEGKYGIVIMADIAVYGKGNARPTGGCGAMAFLMGKNPLILFEPIRSTYMSHVYDFFKPNPSSEYPEVDGVFSLDCYMNALKECFTTLKKKKKFILSEYDYFCFHCPFSKMVEKAFVNLIAYDKENSFNIEGELKSKIEKLSDHKVETSLHNQIKDYLIKNNILQTKLLPSLILNKEIGNSYTSSLYLSLMSLILESNIKDKRILMFSYGSGCAASMFSLKVKSELEIKQRNFDLLEKLSNRIKISPNKFEEMMIYKEKLYLSKNYIPIYPLEEIRESTFYLEKVDNNWRRYYKIKGKKDFQLEFNKLNNSFERLRLLKNQLINNYLNN